VETTIEVLIGSAMQGLGSQGGMTTKHEAGSTRMVAERHDACTDLIRLNTGISLPFH
jgi:hypothetical protein